MKVEFGFSWSFNEWGIPFALSVYSDNGHFQFLCVWISWGTKHEIPDTTGDYDPHFLL